MTEVPYFKYVYTILSVYVSTYGTKRVYIISTSVGTIPHD